MDHPGHLGQVEGRHRREQRADVDLPLGADVEETGAQRQGHRETREDQRRHLHERVTESVVFEERPLEERGVGFDGIGPAGDDQHRAHEQGREHRPHALEHVEEADEAEHHTAASAAPPMSMPSRSGVASAVDMTPVMRPLKITAILSLTAIRCSSSVEM